jgi:hypothetical protein
MTGHGSGYSAQICREMGWDPEMRIGPKSELPSTERPAVPQKGE